MSWARVGPEADTSGLDLGSSARELTPKRTSARKRKSSAANSPTNHIQLRLKCQLNREISLKLTRNLGHVRGV